MLFVGNSYTLYHDVPGQVAKLAAAAGKGFDYETILEGGAALAQHWSERDAGERVRGGGFTHVVLQERSTGLLLDASGYRASVARFAEVARSVRARLVLFETWARAEHSPEYRWPWSRRSPEGWLETVRRRIGEVAAKHGGEVAPVGYAWMRAHVEHPEITLHDEDHHHATIAGAHLAALVLYRTIFRESPREPGWFPHEIGEDSAKNLRDCAVRVIGA